MKEHRLDYGSFTIHSAELTLNPGVGCFVLSARCVCSAIFTTEGATFCKAHALLRRDFAEHLAGVEDDPAQPTDS